MNNPFLRSSIQFADCLGYGSFCLLDRGSIRNCFARFCHKGASAPTVNPISHAALFILPVSLDLRLNISQSRSSKKAIRFDILNAGKGGNKMSKSQEKILPERSHFVQ
jgi:hypothetical protein